MNVTNSDSGDMNDHVMPIDGDRNHITTNEVLYQPDLGIQHDSELIDKFNISDKLDRIEKANDQDVNPIGSTGAYDEYTATKEEETKKSSIYVVRSSKSSDQTSEERPWFYDEPVEELKHRRVIAKRNHHEKRRILYHSLLAALMMVGVFIIGVFLF